MGRIFDPLFDLITLVLAWFYSLWPSYSASISLLTLTVVVAVTPLTIKTTRSMLKMQQHMPEIKRIQNQHRGDPQAGRQAVAAYYSEHGINPVGCLVPMLVQGPIFLVMYRAVDGLTRRTTEIGTQFGFTSRRYAGSALNETAGYAQTPIERSTLQFDPDFVSRDTDLYIDLSAADEMVSVGIDLSRTAGEAVGDSVVTALPYFLMMLVVFVTSLYQQRQIQGRQRSDAMNAQQQMMMRIIPFMLPIFSYFMPAAVVVYFIVSNFVRIAQQAYITRSFYRGEDSLGAQVAKQRAEMAGSDKSGRSQPKDRTPKSVTQGKGAPTRKRDEKPKAPTRRRDGSSSGASSSASSGQRRGAGRTGKAPTRTRSAGRPSGGRVTPSGSAPSRQNQNRSKSKKKRRR